MNTQSFQSLTVSAIDKPIKAATSISFDIPSQWQAAYRWHAGQHLTLRLPLNDEEVRRCYTISASPDSGQPLRITVKRVRGGIMSNHLNDTLKVGDLVDVMPPFGHFCLTPGARLRRTHYFFSAGSGITPIYAMLHTALLAEPYSQAFLLYGNTDDTSIIFGAELQQLSEQFPGRLTVCHLLSKPSWLRSFNAWKYGRMDAKIIQQFIAEHPPIAQDAQYYICGPGSMNSSVKTALMAIDVPANRIHSEAFGGTQSVDDTVTGMAATATITLNQQQHEIAIAADQTVLQAALQAGLEAPYSCQSGICGACTATLSTGEIHMRACMALEASEINNGKILTCQAVAKTATLQLSFNT